MPTQGNIAGGRLLVPEQRRQLIVDRLRAEGSVTVAALEGEFGVSSMTARRDLQILEREGRARRTHGGAMLPGLARHEDSFQSRLEHAAAAKERLAERVPDLIAEDETVFADSSTTAYYAVTRLLKAGRRATVLTNSVPIMDLLARSDGGQLDLIGLSGSLRRLTSSFVGPLTVAAIEAHFADKLLFSVLGLSSTGVLTDADPLEAEVKRAMISQAREPVLLLDGSKFERTGLSAIGPLSAVSTALVADGGEHVASVAQAGVAVTEV